MTKTIIHLDFFYKKILHRNEGKPHEFNYPKEIDIGYTSGKTSIPKLITLLGNSRKLVKKTFRNSFTPDTD